MAAGDRIGAAGDVKAEIKLIRDRQILGGIQKDGPFILP